MKVNHEEQSRVVFFFKASVRVLFLEETLELFQISVYWLNSSATCWIVMLSVVHVDSQFLVLFQFTRASVVSGYRY